MSAVPAPDPVVLTRWQWRFVGVGMAALGICVLGAFFTPAQFFRAYLFGYLFYLGLGLGAWVILMVYYLTGGAWGFLIRRILEAFMRTLPLLAVLFVPVGFGLGYLYLWPQPEFAEQNPDVQRYYLNPPFFWIRAAFYFLSWLVASSFLSSWSRRQDDTGAPDLSRRLSRLSAFGLILYGITITFASVDWVMSLQPAFHSTIFGPIFASGEILSSHAAAIIVLEWMMRHPALARLVSLGALNDLGNLLLTFLVVWTYLCFFQLMLVWMANLRYDLIWYLPRSRGGWQWVAWALFVFHFAIPFFLLLQRNIKQDPRRLAQVAWLILVMQLLYMHFQVMPAFPDTRWTEHWMDVLIPIGIGGIWLGYFLWQLGQRPLLPLHDPNQGSALHLEHREAAQILREAQHA